MRGYGVGWCFGALLLGCGPAPVEVAESTAGQGGSSSEGPSTTTSGGSASATTGPVADGSGGGGTSTGSSPGATGSTSQGVDPDTGGSTGPGSGDTSTGEGEDRGEESEGSSSGGAGGPTCNELYGAVPQYVLCMETETECHFNAFTDGGNCNEMCIEFGGTCLAAFDNPQDPGTECDIIEPNTDDCFTNRTTEICVCDK